MSEIIPDLPRLLKALDDHDCRYVLVGGMAALLHGSSLPTIDCDLAIAYDAENRIRIVEALAPFHPRPVNASADTQPEWDEKSVVPPWTLVQTDLGRVDLLISIFGIDSFQGLFDRAVFTEFQGIRIRYASLEDLIRMKEAAARTKDDEHLLYLRSLLEIEREEQT